MKYRRHATTMPRPTPNAPDGVFAHDNGASRTLSKNSLGLTHLLWSDSEGVAAHGKGFAVPFGSLGFALARAGGMTWERMLTISRNTSLRRKTPTLTPH